MVVKIMATLKVTPRMIIKIADMKNTEPDRWKRNG